MKLSKRLEAVATLVDVGRRVIDVGCDHGYLDIYLTLNNNNTCLATDINPNALNVAILNIKKHKLEKKIQTKLTNGLSGLKINKSDNIVICGMGTLTILEILKTNTLSDTLIISSNNNVELLRRNIISIGYYIDTELFIIDKNKPYIIIKFRKNKKKYEKRFKTNYKEEDFIFGPFLKTNIIYRNYLINKYKEVLSKISIFKIKVRFKYMYLIFKLNIIGLKTNIKKHLKKLKK